MKQLKIIQIIDSLDVGGAEVLAVNIANELAKQPNIESHFCATRLEGLLKNNIDKQVQYLFLNRKKTVDFSAIFKLKKYIKTHRIQIIHAHGTSSFIAFCVKLIHPKIKIIWHNHSGNYEFLSRKKKYPLKLFSLFFCQIISVNLKLQEWAIKNLWCKNVEFLKNFAFFKSDEKRTVLKGEEGKRIVHLARFRKEKDHHNLLKTFYILKKEHPNWSLHLVGQDYNDSYSDKIKAFINDNHLENAVFLYGVQSDVKYILSQATIGVLSSKSEGLPIALLEYGLANLPVLVTNVGECKNVIKHKNALVESNNSTKFAKALQFLVENITIRKQIQEELNRTVNKEYSIEAGIKKIIQLYRAC